PLSAPAGRRVRAAGAADGAHGHHPAQRRVRRRARDGLHRRPPRRRALHPGDGFLTAHLACVGYATRAASSVCSLSPFLPGEGWGEGLIALVRNGPSPPPPPPRKP